MRYDSGMQARVLFPLLGMAVVAAAPVLAAWPSVTLTNGGSRVEAYLPRPGDGYYQAARFDWSSLLGEIDINGMRCFVRHHGGEHNPAGHDHVAGPAEEFDLETPPPGFADAAPGECFVKIGVGVLRRPDSRDYSFGRSYEIVDHGAWDVALVGSTSILYRHTVALPASGIGYALERRLLLQADRCLRMERALRNTGTAVLRTRHYGHNFVRIDDHPVGRDYRIEFPFAPAATGPRPLPASGSIEERFLGFVPPVLPGTFWTRLTGYEPDASQNRVTVRHVPSGAAVQFATDRPLADLRVYGNSRVICPEAFVDLEVQPQERLTWSTDIRFELPEKR